MSSKAWKNLKNRSKATWICGGVCLLAASTFGLWWLGVGKPSRLPDRMAVDIRIPLSFRTLDLDTALQYQGGTTQSAAETFGRPCAAPPLVRSDAYANIQEPMGHRSASSINLGQRLAAYFGTLHAHTEASDGQGSVAAAYRYARDVAGLDFFAVTDHPEYWLFREHDHFAKQQAAARAATTPTFIGMTGFEYSSTLFGHYIVLNTQHIHNAFEDLSLAGFYQWLAKPEQYAALVIFAHPGFHEYRKSLEFEHFAFDPQVSDRLIGIETIHWDGHLRLLKGYGGELPYIDEALGAGWHLAPLGSEDVHYANWGTRDANRVAVLLPRLSEGDIIRALRARHFYATNNRDLQFALNVQRRDGGWAVMGDRVPRRDLPPGQATVKARYYDKDCQDYPRRFELVMNGQVISHYDFPAPASGTAFPFAGEFTATLPLAGKGVPKHLYLYARFVQGAAGDTFTESAPLFLDLD